jgi:two-component system chemotaxis response regulator CheY
MGGLASKLEVMVVDDTSVSRMLITEALSEIGITNLALAKDGKQALGALMAKPVHLVISDQNMPILDGLGLLKALREFKPTSRIGFILISGSPDKTLIERGRVLGLNNFIAKPFNTRTVRAAIEAVVGKLS